MSFAGLTAFFAEPIVIWRAADTAHLTESRDMPRGAERDVWAGASFGKYNKNNSIRIEAFATLSAERSNYRKGIEGEHRERGLKIQITQPIYATDNETSHYADIVEARGERHRVTDVMFDNVAGTYHGTLRKVSDDPSVDTGVR